MTFCDNLWVMLPLRIGYNKNYMTKSYLKLSLLTIAKALHTCNFINNILHQGSSPSSPKLIKLSFIKLRFTTKALHGKQFWNFFRIPGKPLGCVLSLWYSLCAYSLYSQSRKLYTNQLPLPKAAGWQDEAYGLLLAITETTTLILYSSMKTSWNAKKIQIAAFVSFYFSNLYFR